MPVLDPLQLARDGCAAHFEAQGARHTAKDFREGRRDGSVPMVMAQQVVRVALEAAARVADANSYDCGCAVAILGREPATGVPRDTLEAARAPDVEPSCNGRWGTCPNAYQTLEAKGNMRGVPIMRCRLTGKHPDECRPADTFLQASVRPSAEHVGDDDGA